MRHLLLSVFLLISYCSLAQNVNSKTPRILFLLDGSSSMREQWNSEQNRFNKAAQLISVLIDSFSHVDPQTEFGLRLFGHQYPAQQKNCYDTKLEVPFSRNNQEQIEMRLSSLNAYGVSPIANSLREAAAKELNNPNKYAYSIILLTDGGESCGGDMCKVIHEDLPGKIFFPPYVISLVEDSFLKNTYNCLGTVIAMTNEPQVSPGVSKIVLAHHEGFIRAKEGIKIDVLPGVGKTENINNTVKQPLVKKTGPTSDTRRTPARVVEKKAPPPKQNVEIRNKTFNGEGSTITVMDKDGIRDVEIRDLPKGISIIDSKGVREVENRHRPKNIRGDTSVKR